MRLRLCERLDCEERLQLRLRVLLRLRVRLRLRARRRLRLLLKLRKPWRLRLDPPPRRRSLLLRLSRLRLRLQLRLRPRSQLWLRLRLGERAPPPVTMRLDVRRVSGSSDPPAPDIGRATLTAAAAAAREFAALWRASRTTAGMRCVSGRFGNSIISPQFYVKLSLARIITSLSLVREYVSFMLCSSRTARSWARPVQCRNMAMAESTALLHAANLHRS